MSREVHEPVANGQRADHEPRVAPRDVAVRAHEARSMVFLQLARRERFAACGTEGRVVAHRQRIFVGRVTLGHAKHATAFPATDDGAMLRARQPRDVEGALMARDEKIELLRTVPLFAGLSKRELRRIGELADEVDLPADRVLMRQGDYGAEMMVIVDGNARIERDGAVIADRGDGEVLGEIALLDGGPRTATVTLTRDSRLLVLGRREFQTAMDELPEVRLRVLEAVARRLRTLDPASVH
jgi:CRP/FNR family cyclic AMP-dependent transcriptional regulator